MRLSTRSPLSFPRSLGKQTDREPWLACSPLARGQDLASYFLPISVAFRYRGPNGMSVPGRLLAPAPTSFSFFYQCRVTRGWGVGKGMKDSPDRGGLYIGNKAKVAPFPAWLSALERVRERYCAWADSRCVRAHGCSRPYSGGQGFSAAPLSRVLQGAAVAQINRPLCLSRR